MVQLNGGILLILETKTDCGMWQLLSEVAFVVEYLIYK